MLAVQHWDWMDGCLWRGANLSFFRVCMEGSCVHVSISIASLPSVCSKFYSPLLNDRVEE